MGKAVEIAGHVCLQLAINGRPRYQLRSTSRRSFSRYLQREIFMGLVQLTGGCRFQMASVSAEAPPGSGFEVGLSAPQLVVEVSC
jgi:hypothetical protein